MKRARPSFARVFELAAAADAQDPTLLLQRVLTMPPRRRFSMAWARKSTSLPCSLLPLELSNKSARSLFSDAAPASAAVAGISDHVSVVATAQTETSDSAAVTSAEAAAANATTNLPTVTPTEHMDASGQGLVGSMQEGLLAMHDALGMPWWGTLVVATLAVRLSFLPLYVVQAHTSAQIARAAPDIRYMKELLDRQLRQLQPTTAGSSASSPANQSQSSILLQRIDKWQKFLTGARAAVRLQTERPVILAIATPLVQIPVFMTFVFVTRGLIAGGGHGLNDGGLFWFVDLTARDETLILPLAAVASTYANLELSFGGGTREHRRADQGVEGGPEPLLSHEAQQAGTPENVQLELDPSKAFSKPSNETGVAAKTYDSRASDVGLKSTRLGMLGVVKDGIQTLLICGLPLVATLPSGAFVYWLTSSAFSASTITVLRKPFVREYLGLPQQEPPPMQSAK